MTLGLPHCRAFHMNMMWPPALIGFHNFDLCFPTMPSARPVHLRNYISFYHWSASSETSIFVKGLPLRRASHSCTVWPPAQTGFHLQNIAAHMGPPVSTGFPSDKTMLPPWDFSIVLHNVAVLPCPGSSELRLIA